MCYNAGELSSLMPKYIVEREIPGAGKMNMKQLESVAEQACVAVHKMGSAFIGFTATLRAIARIA